MSQYQSIGARVAYRRRFFESRARNFASHRHENPGRVAFGSSLWLRFARCVARSVIVVAGKFASILICGLAAELRNSQPQSVLRFCVFGGQGFFGFRRNWKFFAEEIEFILVLAHSHFLSRKTRFNTHHFDADVAISFEAGLKCGCPPILRACADPPETANLRERYFCGAAIQCQRASTTAA